MKHKALTVAIASALAAPMVAQAVDFTVSGHVNRAIVFTDVDGGSSTTVSKDNGSSGTRVRFTGSSDTMAGVTAGVNLELGVNSGAEAAKDVNVRHSNVSFGGEFGTLKLGHTGEAADGVTYNDKSGVFGIGHGQETGDSNASAYTPGMGGSRKAGLHFSSASFGPAQLHVSAADDDRFSAKITFSGDAGVASYGGGIAYLDTGDSYQEVAGGLGLKLSSGVTFSMAGGSRSDGDDASFVQSTIGYVFGNNAVGVSWYGSSDVMGDDGMGDGQAIGLGFKHTMPKAAVEIIAAVQQYSADLANGDEMDDTVAVVGARVKF
ncbi:MAG: porin [Chloroflexi bacterium]|nr:porin [Chloroflexota bacterium]